MAAILVLNIQITPVCCIWRKCRITARVQVHISRYPNTFLTKIIWYLHCYCNRTGASFVITTIHIIYELIGFAALNVFLRVKD